MRIGRNGYLETVPSTSGSFLYAHFPTVRQRLSGCVDMISKLKSCRSGEESSFQPDCGAGLPVPVLSFEFIPPRTEAMEQRLWACIRRLAPLSPRFVSVTYGAGGSTRDSTYVTVLRLQQETDLVPAAHLTCVGASREEIDDVARRYWEAGVRHIIALRGDPPAGGTDYTTQPGGYAYASDLVAGLRRIADFEISVAAYPEGHPAALSPEADLDNLKRKLDAGATRAITQYFFEASTYLRFLDRCLAAGITAPIIPGIMPVSDYDQIAQFSKMCGITVPSWLTHLFEEISGNPELLRTIGSVVAVEQVRALQARGVNEFHVSTLNRPDLSYAIAHILGARPPGGLKQADGSGEQDTTDD